MTLLHAGLLESMEPNYSFIDYKVNNDTVRAKLQALRMIYD